MKIISRAQGGGKMGDEEHERGSWQKSKKFAGLVY